MYLIVLIPDLCTLSYLELFLHFRINVFLKRQCIESLPLGGVLLFRHNDITRRNYLGCDFNEEYKHSL